MNIIEQKIADTLAAFLVSRGDRIASDMGLLEVRLENDAVIVNHGAHRYEVAVHATRLIP